MPRQETTRACLTLRSSQLEALRSLSKETGAPVAELARRAVDAFLASRVTGYLPGSRDSGSDSYQSGPVTLKGHS
jgi:hypothetical protein